VGCIFGIDSDMVMSGVDIVSSVVVILWVDSVGVKGSGSNDGCCADGFADGCADGCADGLNGLGEVDAGDEYIGEDDTGDEYIGEDDTGDEYIGEDENISEDDADADEDEFNVFV